MRNIKLTIEYDGTNYPGWQSQKSKTAIQDIIESALKMVMNEDVEVLGASRTDAGVHALGQVANFKTTSKIGIERIPRALNSILPPDIVIKDAVEVDANFHVIADSIGKRYRYTILNYKYPSALHRDFVYFYPYDIDFEVMQKACKYLIGTHDFTSFRAAGSSTKTSVRTIFGAEFVRKENIIEFYISGDGFLYNMVRIIVGTLLEVGAGKKKPQDIEDIILSKDRKKAGKTVPAHGLCLVEVFY